MVARTIVTKQKVENPAATFEKPRDVVHDRELSSDEKEKALDTWEQDARQLMTASNEGMPGPAEGLNADDHHQLRARSCVPRTRWVGSRRTSRRLRPATDPL